MRAGDPDQPRDDDGQWTDGGGGGGDGGGGDDKARRDEQRRERIEKARNRTPREKTLHHKKEAEKSRKSVERADKRVAKAQRDADEAEDALEALDPGDESAETELEEAQTARERLEQLERGERPADDDGEGDVTLEEVEAAREEAKAAEGKVVVAKQKAREYARAQSRLDVAIDRAGSAEEERDNEASAADYHEDVFQLSKIDEDTRPEVQERALSEQVQEAQFRASDAGEAEGSAREEWREAKSVCDRRTKDADARLEARLDPYRGRLLSGDPDKDAQRRREEDRIYEDHRREIAQARRERLIAKRSYEAVERRRAAAAERLGFWRAAKARDLDAYLDDGDEFPNFVGGKLDADGDGRTGEAEERDDEDD